MKHLGSVKKILEIMIIRKRREAIENITSRYVEKVLKRFNMSDAKPVNVPLGGHFKLSKGTCSDNG